MYSIHTTHDIFNLMEDATALLDLIHTGEIESDNPEHQEKATRLADRLEATIEQLRPAMRCESPFLTYREQIRHEPVLADLTLRLFEWNPVRLGTLPTFSSETITRIALELIAGYANRGEHDPYFNRIAREIRGRQEAAQRLI